MQTATETLSTVADTGRVALVTTSGGHTFRMVVRTIGEDVFACDFPIGGGIDRIVPSDVTAVRFE